MKNYPTLTIFAAAALVLTLTLVDWHSPSLTASAQQPVTEFEIVHFADTKGRITNTQYAFDTTIYAHYFGATPLTLELYLYDERSGLPIPGLQGPCAPCPPITFAGSANRRAIHFEDLIDFSKAGDVVLGIGFLVTRGGDPSRLLMDVYLVNSHAKPAFELSYTLLPLHPRPAGARRL